MRIAGKATGLVLSEHEADLKHPRPDGHVPLVVIGWDRRPRNAELVDALEQGLVEGGCRVQRVGEVPTPGLHHCMLHSQEYVRGFYAAHGYQEHGDTFLEVDIPHVEMRKEL